LIGYDEFQTGHWYFGGVKKWDNTLGLFASRSPLKISTARPGWVLAAGLHYLAIALYNLCRLLQRRP
jgi:hypothetical protein